MSVRRILTWGNGSMSMMLHDGRSFADAAIWPNGKCGYVATEIVRDQDIFARVVERDMRRIGSVRRNLVEELQLSAFFIDGEGADRTTLLVLELLKFIHCIQKASGAVRNKKRRRGGLGGNTKGREVTCSGI